MPDAASTMIPSFPLWLGATAQAAAGHAPLALFLALVVAEVFYLGLVALAVAARGRGGPARTVGPGLLPRVSCIITCYGEGALVQRTIASLFDQDYPGDLEILPVVDGAVRNRETLAAASAMLSLCQRHARRQLRILPKWIRGGRASSLNTGLAVATGSVVLALDGDTSFDRDMVSRLLGYFGQPGVVAVAGTLRVRNRDRNLLTRLQALDYLVFRQLVRAGLGALNTVNNIPGAHGAFRAEVLRAVGGWDNGSAEDVDLCHRIKCCFGQHSGWRIAAAPDVISHTDVPEHWGDFLRQRLRWEGDPAYLFLRKHGRCMAPRLMGWRNYLFTVWYGLVFQLAMPPLMLVALFLMVTVPAASAVTALVAGYALYLGGATALFLLHLALTSDRPRHDLRQAWLLTLYPLFIFLLRAWSGVAVIHSLLARSHRDTSMAPWWVLRKGRF